MEKWKTLSNVADQIWAICPQIVSTRLISMHMRKHTVIVIVICRRFVITWSIRTPIFYRGMAGGAIGRCNRPSHFWVKPKGKYHEQHSDQPPLKERTNFGFT